MSAAEHLHTEPARVLLMHGSFDTLRDQAGAAYSTTTLADIEAMAREPARVEKRLAACVIFSTYVGHDGRTHQVQAERGQYVALPGDIDQGDPHIADVDAAIVAVYGDVRRLIYSTGSAKPSGRKWRYIIPLAEPVPGSIYADVQLAAFDLMAAHGITCDAALSRPGQVAYLPNVPADRRDSDGVPLFYDHWIKGTDLFSVSGSAIEARMIEMQRAEQEAREAAQASARARAAQRRAVHTGNLPAVMDAFNQATRIEDLLEQYGYERHGRDWRSPNQTSGSYATRIMDGGDAWVSLSESDAAAGLGRPGPRGGCFGDAFDLFKHYEHGGDENAALTAAAEAVRLSDGRTLSEARTEEWREQQQNDGARLLKGRGKPGSKPGAKRDWRAMAEDLTVTQDQVKSIEDARPIWLGLVFHQQAHVWVAPPNGGKTAIANHAAADMSAAGFNVLYINLDAGSTDLKYYEAKSRAGGFKMIAPLKEGSSDEDAMKIIDAMVEDEDLSNEVLILDTLKKFVDVISKRQAKEFYKKLRALTRKGCTIIALAHTNKYRDETGDLIYEGTGDLKADTDNVMFLYPLKSGTAGDLRVSTKFDKDRAPVVNATFFIERATRTVTVEKGYVDTQSEALMRVKEEKDLALIEFLRGRITASPSNLSTLLADVAEAKLGFGRRSVERVLKQYRGRHWDEQRAVNNERRYYPLVAIQL